MQTPGWTNIHTKRLQSFIQSIHAQVTFNRPVRFRIHLATAPGAGGYTKAATDAKIFTNKHNAVFLPFTNCPCRADRLANRVGTMQTRHKDICSPGQPVDPFRPRGDYLTWLWPLWNIFIDLTLDFTCMASNAFLNFLKYKKIAHCSLCCKSDIVRRVGPSQTFHTVPGCRQPYL